MAPTPDVLINKRGLKRSQSEQSILLTAQKLFAEKGFENTTSKEIAMQAGVAEGLIFKYFKDKKNLLRQIMLIWFEKNISDLKNLPKYPDDLEQELITLLTWIYNSYYNNLEVHKIVIANHLNAKHFIEFEEERRKYINDRMNLIINRLEIHLHKGRIKPNIKIQNIYEILQSYAITKILFHNLIPDDFNNSISSLTETLLNGISTQ